MMTDKKNIAIRKFAVFGVVFGLVLSVNLSAAVRDNGGSAKIVNKLQTMVKDITAERDHLKVENEKALADLESLKKQSEKEKTAAISDKESFDKELAAKKANTDDLQTRLDATTGRLKEVIDKYNALNKSKNDLTLQHGNLLNAQKTSSSELKICESKNLKLYEVSKEIIAGYKSCQNRGLLDTLVDSEPLLQINNVEFETLMQEFEDKLNKQKYHPQQAVGNTPTAK
jgi:uncharacterized protein (DUF3084 family)